MDYMEKAILNVVISTIIELSDKISDYYFNKYAIER